jgi:hypothetical protein
LSTRLLQVAIGEPPLALLRRRSRRRFQFMVDASELVERRRSVHAGLPHAWPATDQTAWAMPRLGLPREHLAAELDRPAWHLS